MIFCEREQNVFNYWLIAGTGLEYLRMHWECIYNFDRSFTWPYQALPWTAWTKLYLTLLEFTWLSSIFRKLSEKFPKTFRKLSKNFPKNLSKPSEKFKLVDRKLFENFAEFANSLIENCLKCFRSKVRLETNAKLKISWIKSPDASKASIAKNATIECIKNKKLLKNLKHGQ